MVPTGAHWARTPLPPGGGGRPHLRPGEACTLAPPYRGIHVCALGGAHAYSQVGARMHAPAGGREGFHVGWWDIISSALLVFYFPWAEVGLGLVVLSRRVKKLNK
jgi:hypothetical protein